MKHDTRPIATIVAGANASGKSTLIASLYQNSFLNEEECINPDLIVMRELYPKMQKPLNGGRPDPFTRENYLKAFEIADERRRALIEQKKDFVMETVFSTESKLELITDLREKGYFVRLIYVGTDNAETNARYLVRRIEASGHDVPLKKMIRRRFDSMQNIRKVWLNHLCDEVILIDNSVPDTAPLIISCKKDESEIVYDKRNIPSRAWHEFRLFLRKTATASEDSIEKCDALKQRLEQAIQRFFIRTCQGMSYEWTNQFIGERLREGEVRGLLTYTSNTGIFNGYGNRPGNLYFKEVAEWIGPYGRDDTFHTSMIVSYERSGHTLTVNTLNSVYVFEIIKGEPDPDAIELAPQEIVDEFLRRNNAKHSVYWCQVNASGFLEGLIDPVKMPYPMSRQEAIEYVSTGQAVSYDGHIARIVVAPIESKEE